MLPTSSDWADQARKRWAEATPVPGHPRIREFELGSLAYVGVEARRGGADLFRTERATLSRLAGATPRVALSPVLHHDDLLVFPKAAPLRLPSSSGADVAHGERFADLLVRVHSHEAPAHAMRTERMTTMPLTVAEWASTPERVIRLAAELAEYRDEMEALGDLRRVARARNRPVMAHGDFKPDNVLLDDHGSPVAIDWEMSGAGPAVEDFAALWAGLLVELLTQELGRGTAETDPRVVAQRIESRLVVIMEAAVQYYEERSSSTVDRVELRGIGHLRLIARVESLCRARSSRSVEEVFLTRALTHGLRHRARNESSDLR